MFLAIRDIRFAKGRFALMGGVVALLTLLLVLLSGLTAGLGDQSTSAIGKLGAGQPVDSIVFGAPGTNQPAASFTESEVTAAQVDSWKHVPGVASAEALGISQSRLQGGDGGTTNVAVFGVAADGLLAPTPVRAGSVVIGSTVAADLSLAVGDTATVGGTELTVTAVVDDQWYSHTGVVWTALPTWAEVAHLAPAAGSAPGTMPVATVVAVTYAEGAVVDEASADAMARTVSTSRLFAAIFFVAFGLNTDPASIPPVLGWALALALITAASKMATGIWAAKRLGIARPGRLRAGAVLIARGEFSIVIAGLAVASGAVTQELAAMATAYVLIMAVLGPLAARYVEPLMEIVQPPEGVVTKA